MSQELVNRSPDLKRLRDEGFAIEVVQPAYLVVRDVPYVNSSREVKLGILVSELSLANDVTIKPTTHVIFFSGEHPCHKDGTKIAQIAHQSATQNLGGIEVHHSFSNKPWPDGYIDYYDKIDTYVRVISSPAQSINPNATATTFRVIETSEEESVFKYLDSASSRAKIDQVTEKLKIRRLAIIGLGGTGSYVLDFVAKTPVKEIHLFDGDKYLQHNAFRSPGAPSGEELEQQLSKVEYFKNIYSKMRRNIFAHPDHVDASNVDQFKEMDFVFICVDRGSAKKLIIEKLELWGVPFIDVGMGIEKVGTALTGILRTTASTPQYRKHAQKRIDFTDDDPEGVYKQNIQIAELNAFNAAHAVIKWKKLVGFYHDLENEHNSTYSIDCNLLTSEETIEAPDLIADETKVKA
jgi:molybdopterin/thiamine biosynthesis adenylyltransferase